MSGAPPFDPHPPPYVTPVPSPMAGGNDTRIPGPPPMPTDIGPTEPSTKPPPAQLDQLEEQLAAVHDALYSPDGMLHSLFANLTRQLKAQHEESMRTLTTISNGQMDLSDRVAQLEPAVEQHDAELRLVALRGGGE